MSFAPDSVPRRAAGAAGQRFGDEFVVLDPAGRMLRGFNETAARVWALCDGTRTARDVARGVLDAFQSGAQSLDAERVLEDTLRFLTQLREHGLVEELRAGAGPAHPEVP
ncbi:PqqD family protein [Myxococcaceae bacterium GXIMD 01537]